MPACSDWALQVQSVASTHIVVRTHFTAERGLQQLWWPFTQHQGISAADVTVMEGRWGEYFQTIAPGQPPSMVPMYDACGSWWTQGGGSEAHAHLARQVGLAAGRYLHMMLPENVNPPVLDVAARLLEGPGAQGLVVMHIKSVNVGFPWASKVFLSDNGSTAVEVALKMAFRTFLTRAGLLDREHPPAHGAGPTLHVLALMSSYHGDTLGSMDCAAPSVFNGILEAPWYGNALGTYLSSTNHAMQSTLLMQSTPRNPSVNTKQSIITARNPS